MTDDEIDDVIKKAIRAIGCQAEKPVKRDDHLKPHEQLDILKANPAGVEQLIAIIERDPLVEKYRQKVMAGDNAAGTAQTRFRRWTRSLSTITLSSAMFAIFFLVAPTELSLPARSALSIATGYVLAALGGWAYEGMFAGAKRVIALFAFGAAAAALLIPANLDALLGFTRWVSLAVLIGALLVWDFKSAGASWQALALSLKALAKLRQWLSFGKWPMKPIDPLSHASLLQAWHMTRGDTEALRRSYFLSVAAAEPEKENAPAGAGASPAIPLPLLKLEFARRFLVSAQQRYYQLRSKDHLSGAARVPRAQVVAFVILCIAGAVFGMAHLGHFTEQASTGDWLDLQLRSFPRLASASIWLLENGFDDVSLLVLLAAFGTYFVLFIDSTTFDERRNAIRYQNTKLALEALAGPEPDNERESGYALGKVRKSAVKLPPHEADAAVREYLRGVCRCLAAETISWSDQTVTPFLLENSTLSSPQQLFPHDFDRIAEEMRFTQPVRKARRVAPVAARKAVVEEHFTTYFGGAESQITAHPGDWVVTNLDRDGNILLEGGKSNIYVIGAKGFADRYEPIGHFTDGLQHFKRKDNTEIDVIEFSGGIFLVAPWGEIQRVPQGYLARSGRDIYCIDTKAFAATYDLVAADNPA